jgi:hypothetical protein
MENRSNVKSMNCGYSKLAQIKLLFDNYYHHGAVPPPIKKGQDGKPWHSWRILIWKDVVDATDHIGDYDFSKPYNADHNIFQTQQKINKEVLFTCPFCEQNDQNGITNYVAVLTSSGDWFTTLCKDEDVDEILLVICDRRSQIQITEPRDVTLSYACEVWKYEKPKHGFWGNYNKNNFGVFWSFSKNTVIYREYNPSDLKILEELQNDMYL